MRNKPLRILFSMFLLFFVLGSTGCSGDKSRTAGEEQPDPYEGCEQVYGVAVWPDETGADTLAQWYPFFARNCTELYVEVLERQVLSRDQEIARIFREAAAQGLHVRPYIILPFEDGLYPNEANFEQFFGDVKAMIAWVEEQDLPVSWIAVDMETPVQMVGRLEQYLANLQLFRAYAFLLSHRDPVEFRQSVANYQALVDYCHEHEFKVHAVSFPFVLDDHSDADTGLQDAFDVPVSGVDWDEVDFMVYRTMYRDYTGFPFTSDLVYRYAGKARTIYGDRASTFVGLVLWPGWSEGEDTGYQEPVELEADMEAVLAADIRRIHLFYLTGLLSKENPEAWMSPVVSDYVVPEQDPFTTLFVDIGMPLLDLIL